MLPEIKVNQIETEAILIEGCMNNDEKSQELLYKRYFAFVYSISIRYLANKNEAIEVVDDSFMKVFKKICTFKDNENFKGWIARIVINTSIDRLRRGKKENEIGINEEDIHLCSNSTSDMRLNYEDIVELLKYLPYYQRVVFNLIEIEGFSHKDAALFLDIPESSSRTYLTRAKEKLRSLYKKFFK